MELSQVCLVTPHFSSVKIGIGLNLKTMGCLPSAGMLWNLWEESQILFEETDQ